MSSWLPRASRVTYPYCSGFFSQWPVPISYARWSGRARIERSLPELWPPSGHVAYQFRRACHSLRRPRPSIPPTIAAWRADLVSIAPSGRLGDNDGIDLPCLHEFQYHILFRHDWRMPFARFPLKILSRHSRVARHRTTIPRPGVHRTGSRWKPRRRWPPAVPIDPPRISALQAIDPYDPGSVPTCHTSRKTIPNATTQNSDAPRQASLFDTPTDKASLLRHAGV